MAKGVLIVISGPSGCGKGTVIGGLLKRQDAQADLSISCTTRALRGTEKDGVNYFFKTEEEFEQMIAEGAFLEYAHVFGKYYGTPKSYVLEKLNAGRNVILEIDVQGGMQIKKNFPDAVLIFILPPSMKELYKRLKNRSTETPELVAKRYNMARGEIEFARKYDFVVMNDALAQAVDDVGCVLKTARMQPSHTDLIDMLLEEGE
jgi:guanylate kinase